MNKAILIVICDFLVSAMLTMMTGMVPAHSGGTGVGLDEKTTKVLLRELDRQNSELEALRAKLRETVEKLGMTPEREAELRRLAEELAANRVQQQKLLAAQNATAKNTGVLTPEELQRRLDAEMINKTRLEIELKDSQTDLAASRAKAGDISKKLQETTAQLVKTSETLQGELREIRREASAQREELSSERRKHDETKAKLERAQNAHSETRIALARVESELDSERRSAQQQQQEAKAEVKRLSDALGKSRGTGEKQLREIATLRGRLSERQKEHATDRDRIGLLERQILVERMKSAEAKGRAEVVENTLKSTVAELSKIRAQEQVQMREKAQAQAKLEAAQKMLAEKGRPVDVALQSYAKAIVNVRCEVSEKTAFRTLTGKSESFYPVVDFGGKTILVGLLNRFAGDENVALSFKNIINVKFTASSPLGGNSKALTGAMYLPNSDRRIAGFPYQNQDCRPLKLLTADQLVRRGLNGLHLFKRTSGANATLTGRASLSFKDGKYSFFVRNAGRANNELKAEPGDIIVSSEGDFVGIAIANGELDGVRGVQIALFSSPDVWQNTAMVPLDKLPGEKSFSRYAAVMRKIRTVIRPGYDQR